MTFSIQHLIGSQQTVTKVMPNESVQIALERMIKYDYTHNTLVKLRG
ncbi:hypothetical protein [Anabaena sp. 90]|nr:hypothetical protein [Anabaena sp. 90]